MQYAPIYPMQTGGNMRWWSDPARTYRHALVKLQFDCEADPYPGILILTDASYSRASAMEIQNLRKQLPKIIEPLGDNTIAYWRMIRDDAARTQALKALTVTPVFDDILG